MDVVIEVRDARIPMSTSHPMVNGLSIEHQNTICLYFCVPIERRGVGVGIGIMANNIVWNFKNNLVYDWFLDSPYRDWFTLFMILLILWKLHQLVSEIGNGCVLKLIPFLLATSNRIFAVIQLICDYLTLQLDSWLGNRKRILVLNREDMITAADRNAWATYYASQGIKVVFSNGQLGMVLQQCLCP